MNRFLGQMLLWVGFLSAAYVTVSRLEVEKEPWQSIPWIWYSLFMAVGIAGVIVMRTSAKAAQKHSERVAGEFTIIIDSMATLVESVQELRGRMDSMSPRNVVQFIDDRCATAFSDFADARNALIQRFGLQGFADIMTQFASAERYVNRTWSAAADGYMHEAADSLRRAEEHLMLAQQRISDLDQH